MSIQTDPHSNPDLLKKIMSGDRVLLRKLYEQFRTEFRLWLTRNYQCDDDMIADIYQQAFTTLYYNIKDGRLTELTSSIKTYLFAIGKNLLRDHYKVSTRRREILEVAIDNNDIDFGILEHYEQAETKETVRSLLSRIGEPCKTVLELFYLKGFAMDAIANEMNYKTEQIAAKRKFICLRQMRELLLESESGSN
jgi:RNA polymerase sigma-70 factor (ECF subfamily)